MTCSNFLLFWLAAGLGLAGCTANSARVNLFTPGTGEPIWAVRCDAVRGPDRVRLANHRAEALRRVRGLKPDLVQVVHQEEESIVYYGRYRRQSDSQTGTVRYQPDPKPDLDLIRSLSLVSNGRNFWPFMYATLEELPIGRPQHPEWDLNHARGYWTLHVAVFFDDGPITNRRWLAEEYCRELREQGVEAYFHHGPALSSVCVGAFPQSAVQTVKEIHPLSGIATFKNKIVDPRLLELQRRFPESYWNGKRVYDLVYDPQRGEKVRLLRQSFVAKLPRAEQTEAVGQK